MCEQLLCSLGASVSFVMVFCCMSKTSRMSLCRELGTLCLVVALPWISVAFVYVAGVILCRVFCGS